MTDWVRIRKTDLLILDADDFKRFNDTYGHLEGDTLLKGLADVIRGTIRRSDAKPSYEVDIACRYGGEEFAVILPEAAQVQGGAVAERLRASIEARGAGIVAERIRRKIEATPLGGKTVTVSIGVSSYPDHGADAESRIRAADEAMYKAKRAGKNRVAISGKGQGERRLGGGRSAPPMKKGRRGEPHGGPKRPGSA